MNSALDDDVVRIGKKLDKMINGTKSMDSANDLLEVLSKMPITLEILTKTRIGMTINDLRKKSDDEKVSKRAKSLIKDWKGLLESKKEKATVGVLPRNESIASDLGDETTTVIRPSPAPPVRQQPSVPLKGDEVRAKCREMLESALRFGEMPDGTLDPEAIAAEIEEKLFTAHRGTTDKYKASVRSRVFNLRDKRNTALRENVLTGQVAPNRFATMSAEEMASPEIRAMRERFTKEAINDAQVSVNEGTATDLFKCGKCLKKNCTYSQLQTRSSDEPMTTFVFCRECGNRWKFC